MTHSFSSVQFSCSVVANSATPWIATRQASLSFTISWNLLKLMSVESVMPSNYLILGHPLLFPSIFPSIRVFSNESTFLITWPKYWSFISASVLPVNIQGWFPLGLTGLISFQSKELSRVFSSTTVQKHQFFGAQPSLLVQLSHPYLTPGKTITLTLQAFVGKVMSLSYGTVIKWIIFSQPSVLYHFLWKP